MRALSRRRAMEPPSVSFVQAVESGKHLRVVADETRPFLQGARLTAWELWKDEHRRPVIADNMAGTFMHQGLIDGRHRRRRQIAGQR